MQLFHTSPNEITEISRYGQFDDCLFFSANPYEMSAAETVLYSIEIAESSIIEVSSFYYQENSQEILASLVEEISEICNVDADTAENILDGSDSAWNHIEDGTDAAEADWRVQALQGRAATLLGFEAAQAEDEQGAVYIIPMAGREADLVLE